MIYKNLSRVEIAVSFLCVKLKQVEYTSIIAPFKAVNESIVKRAIIVY